MPKGAWKPSKSKPSNIPNQNSLKEKQEYIILGQPREHIANNIETLSQYIKKLPATTANNDLKEKLRENLKAMQTAHDIIEKKLAGEYKYNAETLDKIAQLQNVLFENAEIIAKGLSVDPSQDPLVKLQNEKLENMKIIFAHNLENTEKFINLSNAERGNINSYTLPELKGKDMHEKAAKFTDAQTINSKFTNSKDNLAFSSQSFYLCGPKDCEENIKAFYDLAEGKFNKEAKLTFNFEHDSLDSKQCATNPRYNQRVQMMMKEHLARGYGLTPDQHKMWDQMCGKNPQLRTEVDDRRKALGLDTEIKKNTDNQHNSLEIKVDPAEEKSEGVSVSIRRS